jgi:type III pantothenate kinase
MAERTLIAISVGNTRTSVARFTGSRLDESEAHRNDDLPAIVACAARHWPGPGEADLVMASVNDPVANRIASALEDQLGAEIYRIGTDIPLGVEQVLEPETMTGADRLLNALAAFDTLQQACVVVDAGTAITVDFVDGAGVFHGGAIAPGARMQLAALHEKTAALPEVDFAAPSDDVFGRSTAQAMLNGVYHGIRGMVTRLVERYAERYGAYPMVIVTGGDAPLLFESEELVDRVVPDLTLRGIAIAARLALARDDAAAE